MLISTAGAVIQKNALSILVAVLIQSDKRFPGLELPAHVWHKFSHLSGRMGELCSKIKHMWAPGQSAYAGPWCHQGLLHQIYYYTVMPVCIAHFFHAFPVLSTGEKFPICMNI